MKISKSTLKQIIKEEFQAVLQEAADVPNIENCNYLTGREKSDGMSGIALRLIDKDYLERPTHAPLSPEKEKARMALYAGGRIENALKRAFGCAGSLATPRAAVGKGEIYEKCQLYYKMLDKDKDLAVDISRLGDPDQVYQAFMQDVAFDAALKSAYKRKGAMCRAQESSQETQRRSRRDAARNIRSR